MVLINYSTKIDVIIRYEANLPAAGSIFVSIGGGRIIGKVFQCHKTSFAKSITGLIYSSVSKIEKTFKISIIYNIECMITYKN